MNAYILTWNPSAYAWDNIDEDIDHIMDAGAIDFSWTCMSSKPKPGDEFYLSRVNAKRRGIVARGVVENLVKQVDSNYNSRGISNLIEGKLYDLLNPNHSEILSIDKLRALLPDQVWNPRQSGIIIKDSIVPAFRKLWKEFYVVTTKDFFEPSQEIIFEGGPIKQLSTKYERSPSARDACINFFGYCCQVCGLNFEEKYGTIGKDFIHVHHKNFLSALSGEHAVDPTEDLIPVCPNCHAMLHRKSGDGTYPSVEELTKRLRAY